MNCHTADVKTCEKTGVSNFLNGLVYQQEIEKQLQNTVKGRKNNKKHKGINHEN